ncbi:gamma-type small acid-soluble spore protein [Virgibacillus sp. MG-45]|uniref:gamma-type small acid-soluble spore protein n=1 Tax=Virgibacillus sp. MG-45 TaxID=3102791 RepID=UPI002ED8E466
MKNEASNKETNRKDLNTEMSYNEAKEWIAKTTGGHGTSIYSDTDVAEVRKQNAKSMQQSKTE